MVCPLIFSKLDSTETVQIKLTRERSVVGMAKERWQNCFDKLLLLVNSKCSTMRQPRYYGFISALADFFKHLMEFLWKFSSDPTRVRQPYCFQQVVIEGVFVVSVCRAIWQVEHHSILRRVHSLCVVCSSYGLVFFYRMLKRTILFRSDFFFFKEYRPTSSSHHVVVVQKKCSNRG